MKRGGIDKMKKNVLTSLGVLGAIGILCLIFTPKEKLQIFIDDGKSKGEMKLVSSVLPIDYKNGYFYIKKNGYHENIMYFDYDAKKEVYLCNKPNCKHNSTVCSSYLDFKGANELFYSNDSLYFLDSSAKGDTIVASADGTVQSVNQKPSTLYKINLDGTEKQKVFTTPSGTRISMPYVINGNKLYGYLEKRELADKQDSSITAAITERKLIVINLDTGKYEELKEGLYETLIGVYKGKLVIQEIDYLKDPNYFKDDTNAFLDNLYNSKTKIKLLDVETKKEEYIYEDIYKNMEKMQFYKDGIYIKGKNSKTLEYIDFSTKKKEVIKELPQSTMEISTIIDDKVLVYSYKDKEAHLGDAYYIDLATKEMKPFNLKDKNEYLVEILASNDDYYFVKLETILGEEYTTWAGTKTRKIIGIGYGLIKKADYWLSKENYIKMTSIK